MNTELLSHIAWKELNCRRMKGKERLSMPKA